MRLCAIIGIAETLLPVNGIRVLTLSHGMVYFVFFRLDIIPAVYISRSEKIYNGQINIF